MWVKSKVQGKMEKDPKELRFKDKHQEMTEE